MAWWRRDPSLYTRSPIHRYAQRILRDHEAALRTRCFSRTPSKGAQHEDESGERRPPHLSDLEWMQLKHYNRWRKRVQEDPYKAIFGASSDMLNGKGLIDWEWINKSFPKWMLNEVDENEQPRGKRDSSTTAREPIFPQPSFRKQSLDRDGVKSPSDSRRPREDSYVKVVGKASNDASNDTSASSRSQLSTAPESVDQFPANTPSDFVSSIAQTGSHNMVQKEEITDTSQNKAEGSLEPKNSEDATRPPRPATTLNRRLQESNRGLNEEEQRFWKDLDHQSQQNLEADWRLTAVQRRLRIPALSRKQLSLDAEHLGYTSLDPPAMASERTDGKIQETHLDHRISAKSTERDASIPVAKSNTEQDVSSTRSISEKLKQLPENDIDFLSAADIRATMGSKRAWLPSDEQKQASRQTLEPAYNGGEETSSIHPILGAKNLNNPHVRRAERHEQRANEKEAEDLEKASFIEPIPEAHVQAPAEVPAEVPAEAPAESGIERMKRWLETTGASFAKTFWQDPTEEADVTKTKLFFDKVAHYVKKGQAANRQITEDLEKDIPVSKALLKRFKSDEKQLDLAIHRLRQRTSSGQTQDLSPRKIRAMESLKARFHQTNRELEVAYEALRGLVGSESVTNATPSFKRRLSTASKVLHKNSQLLRMLIWSLQTRLEDPKIDRKILSNYKVVADNLLSLRDTQMTLMRLVDRAMLVYGVVPGERAENDTPKIKLEDFENCEDPFVRARLAADVHLINEIKAHKSKSKESVAEAPVATPKTSNSKILDEPSPLMNSLFRPFGPVIEKLGNKALRESAAEKALEEEKRKLGDVKLVDNIKAAYEDTYGAITVDHRQTPFEIPEVKAYAREGPDAEEDRKAAAHLDKMQGAMATPFDMLKDDPSSTSDSSKETTAAILASDRPTELFSKNVAEPKDLAHSPEIVAALHEPKLRLWRDTIAPTAAGTTESVEQQAEPANVAESTQTQSPQDTQQVDENMHTAPAPATEHLPTHYTIVVHDPETDTLSITTSTTGPPRDTSPAVPLHLALSSLENPAKFIPAIAEGLEVVSANKHILVLRDAIENDTSTRPFSTVAPSSSTAGREHIVQNHGATNPIDGTTRLSPTGYVGPEESAEQLEKDFLERRRAADTFQYFKDTKYERGRFVAAQRKAQRKARTGSVVKTAIWVAGLCYIAGVIGEICT